MVEGVGKKLSLARHFGFTLCYDTRSVCLLKCFCPESAREGTSFSVVPAKWIDTSLSLKTPNSQCNSSLSPYLESLQGWCFLFNLKRFDSFQDFLRRPLTISFENRRGLLSWKLEFLFCFDFLSFAEFSGAKLSVFLRTSAELPGGFAFSLSNTDQQVHKLLI